MQLLEMTMPADFETLRQQKGASLIFTTLEILEDIERSSDSILIRCANLLLLKEFLHDITLAWSLVLMP